MLTLLRRRPRALPPCCARRTKADSFNLSCRIPSFTDAKQRTSLADVYEPGDPIIPRPPRQSSLKNSRDTSPSTSRSVSRSASRSGRSTPAISSHRAAADGSTVNLKGRSAAVSTPSTKSAVKGKGKDSSTRDLEASESTAKPGKTKVASSARPTASSINKASSSRRPVSILSSSGHRVSTIANHFNKITRDADRERQRRLALFGARKRPRPVATAEPTVVRVFDNVKDAVKDNSDDETDGASSGADDEYDDEIDVDGRDEQKVGREAISHCAEAREPSAASSKEIYVYGTDEPTNSIVDALLHLPVALPVDEPCGTNVDDAEAPLAGCEKVQPPSVPPSPLLPDSVSLPRMSEGESSGNEQSFISKTISGWFPYRGAELPPLATLEYALALPIRVDRKLMRCRLQEPARTRFGWQQHLDPRGRAELASGVCAQVRSLLPLSLRRRFSDGLVVHSSKKYKEKLKENNPHTRVHEQSEPFLPDDPLAGDRSSTWGLLDVALETDLEETLLKPEQMTAYLGESTC